MRLLKKLLSHRSVVVENKNAPTEELSLEDETVASESWLSAHSEPPITKVQFNDDATVYIDCPWVVEEECEESETWYSKDDVRLFKMEANLAGTDARLRERQMGNKEWSTAVMAAFKRCQSLESAEDVRELMTTAKYMGLMGVDPRFVGVDRWALPEIKATRSNVRRTLQDKVQEVQFRSGNLVKREKELQRACKEVTRTSRFFALFLGKMMEQ